MKIIPVLLAVAILTLSTACSGPSPAAGGADRSDSYTDDFGRTVEIKGIPEKIISLAPSNTELVYALGLEDRLIGVTSYCDYPPKVKEKPVVSDFSQVNIEKIVSLEPDLVLAGNIHKEEAIPALEKLDIAVLGIDPPTMEGIFSDILLVGRAAGIEPKAKTLVDSLENRVKTVSQRTQKLSLEERPRVLFVVYHDPLWVAGSATLIDDLIRVGGGTNIASDLEGHAQISLETAIDRNPQVICVMSSMGTQNTSFEYIKSEPRFRSTEALKNNRVFSVDISTFGRTTPRSVDALEEMAKILHPDNFK